MHTPDITKKNITAIGELFPNAITETLDKDGRPKVAIDFDLLRQELSDHLVEGPQERYQLDWPGKRESLLAANAPIAKSLRPSRDESVDFDTTKNLFIEGDNLDALKLLQETYLGKVKMIYIDPPYNTGNDFIYEDDFTDSDWLSMMYSRLRLARNLLAENGVIFISIDDNEVANCRKLCDEIFGSINFVAEFTWETKRAARGVPPKNLLMSNHEYVICYARDASLVRFAGLARDENDFGNPDNDPRGLWRSESMKATGQQDNYFTIEDPKTGNCFHANWAFSESTIKQMINDGLVLFPDSAEGTPRQKKFFDSYTNESKAATTALGWHSTERATKNLMSLFGERKVFPFPKPLTLLEFLCSQTLETSDLVLDFFAGSASTAHAVMELNAKDGGNRRYIMVQIPEECPEGSDARKVGYTTIAEISKERIRLAGAKIVAGDTHEEWNKDIGFRVLKIDSEINVRLD